MKKILLGIAVLFLTASTVYCQEASQPLPQSKGTSPLTLTIKTDKDVYESGENINCTLTIKNNSKDTIAFEASTSFRLESEERPDPGIWGPVSLDKEGLLGANGRSHLNFGPFEEKIFKRNLNEVKWENSVSSVWPSRPLGSLITSGKYILSFDIEVTKGDKRRFTSNPVTIEVEEKEKNCKQLYQALEDKIEKSSYCEIDNDCLEVYSLFNCGFAVNREKHNEIQLILKEYEEKCLKEDDIVKGCAMPVIKCENNTCKRYP